jgi:hypothetical protein
MSRRAFFFVTLAVAAAATGCEEIPSSTGGGGAGGSSSDPGTALDVPTGTDSVYVDLDAPAIVTATDAWELRFDGPRIFTNGGASGTGKSAAFGPNDLEVFDAGDVPTDVPFLIKDEAGGAFIKWYAYDGSTHLLYSRFHVYGVRRASELYKVQILGFYGEQAGAPVSALYQLRAAKVSSAGVETTVTYTDVDGTAGSTSEPTPSDPSGCIRLSTGIITSLTPAEAAASPDWDLCFRRATISVNGGDGAAGDVEAVDLMADQTASEVLEDVMMRTADSELPAFDAVTNTELTATDLSWLKDGVVSAFTNKWTTAGSNPLEPAPYSWIVAGSDGETPFAVVFDGFDGATATEVGTVHLRVKQLKGSLP